MANLAALQESIGVFFNDQSLLEEALIHSSYVNENPRAGLRSNERLEFLGDAVLGLVTAEKLYREFPLFTEGEMTRLRAAVVRREALARMAKAFSLGEYLYVGKGEEASGGRSKPANLASALEALIAAVYLDQGSAIASKFVLGLLDKELRKVSSDNSEVDYKSRLQETIQAKEQRTPTYHVIESTGPPHNRIFTVEVRVEHNTLGRGSGKSKKAAENEAARIALEYL